MDTNNIIKTNLSVVKKVVFKFGTNVLRDDSGKMSFERIANFVKDIAEIHKTGKDVIIVTSGAVGLGANQVNVNTTGNLVLKQACAAIGQPQLMSVYVNEFSKYDIDCAQVLLTEDDFTNRLRYLNLSNVLAELLRLRVIPIINQNDTVSSSELEETMNLLEVSFSDNDKLSALLASKCEADLLVILSDIDALYDDNPKTNPNAKKISVVEEVTPEIEQYGQSASLGGRGGMKTKLEAAKVVTRSGSRVIIANGKTPSIINKIFKGDEVGTLFLPSEQLSGRRRWIGFATNIAGKLIVNEGAKKAITQKDASLLPIGIIDIVGDFHRGEVVSISDESGIEFARGISNYNCSDCKKIIGKHSDFIQETLGYKNYDAVITRDNLVIF